jgi:hypothetical protein
MREAAARPRPPRGRCGHGSVFFKEQSTPSYLALRNLKRVLYSLAYRSA